MMFGLFAFLILGAVGISLGQPAGAYLALLVIWIVLYMAITIHNARNG